MAVLGGAFEDFQTAYKKLFDIIQSGLAIDKFNELILIQGGNPDFINNPAKLPQSKYNIEVKAKNTGYVNEIDAEIIGLSAMLLGAGRRTKDDFIDHAAGITLNKKIGDKVLKGETLCVLHTNKEDNNEAIDRISEAYLVNESIPEKEKYVYDIIE